MKRKSPINVGMIQFYNYEKAQIDELAFINQFPFDDRSDFVADADFGGIAVKITVSNVRFDSGVRRNVALILVDVTARYEVACQSLKINLHKQDYDKVLYAHFSVEDMVPGHIYKLVISDSIASQTLAEKVFHLINPADLPHPAWWYEVRDGGLRPGWESNLYKTIKTDDWLTYYVRFNIEQKLGSLLPSVMPELELRLYFSDSQEPMVQFREPVCLSEDDYKENHWYVEFPFTTSIDRNGVLYAELLCMEYPIAGFVFDTNADDECGKWCGEYLKSLDEYSMNAAIKRWSSSSSREEDCILAEHDEFDQMLDKFIAEENETPESEPNGDLQESDMETQSESRYEDSFSLSMKNLTGLRSVKEKLAIYERMVCFNKMRSDKGLPTISAPLHSMFLGSPGTGKTTVAKVMGEMLRNAGVLSKGHVVIRERATLLGQNYNSESEKTLAAIEEAQGGILFIDEAYQLFQPNDSRDPGKFVIETLLTALADETNRDWMLILAGYSDKMKRMFEMNPGFKSRIPDSNIYIFDDFTESELMEIAENYLIRNNYTLSADARQKLTDRLNADYAHRDESFGNARHVINLIQTEILPSMAVRVINEGLDDVTSLTEIQATDIPAPVRKLVTSHPRVGFVI